MKKIGMSLLLFALLFTGCQSSKNQEEALNQKLEEARLLAEETRWEEAIAAYEEAVVLSPDEGAVYLEKGAAEEQAGGCRKPSQIIKRHWSECLLKQKCI